MLMNIFNLAGVGETFFITCGQGPSWGREGKERKGGEREKGKNINIFLSVEERADLLLLTAPREEMGRKRMLHSETPYIQKEGGGYKRLSGVKKFNVLGGAEKGEEVLLPPSM